MSRGRKTGHARLRISARTRADSLGPGGRISAVHSGNTKYEMDTVSFVDTYSVREAEEDLPAGKREDFIIANN